MFSYLIFARNSYAMKHAGYAILVLLIVSSWYPACFSMERGDSTATRLSPKSALNDRNVMLNASSSSRPRDISTGLPGDDSGTAVFEDGMPVAAYSWPAYPNFHWAGGNSYSSQSLRRIEETALYSSIIGYSIDSRTTLGTDTLHSAVSGQTGSFGFIRTDAVIDGPIGRGWYASGGVFINGDPTSVRQPSKPFVNEMLILKASLTRRWNGNRGESSIMYKFSDNRDGTYGYASSPFYYVGDGSIKAYGNFRLGHDSYFPSDDSVRYMDVIDGTMHSDRLGKMNTKKIHDLMLTFKYSFPGGWKLDAGLHASGSKRMDNLGTYETGIDSISAGKDNDGNAFTSPSGAPFTGLAQNRLVLLCRSDYLDVMASATLSRRLGRHELQLGTDEWYDYQFLRASTFKFAHTVEASPERLTRNGDSTWGFNDCAEYNRGFQNVLALRIVDDWSLNDRISIYYGTRLELVSYNVTAPVNVGSEDCNSRHERFYVNDGRVVLHDFADARVNAVLLGSLSYRLRQRLFLSGEYLLASSNKTGMNYATADMPDLSPSIRQMGRLGVIYDGKFLTVSSMLSYIGSNNNIGVMHFTKQIEGVSKTFTTTSVYGIGTIGFTTDITGHYEGFNIHLLATFQEPKYRDFKSTLDFDDGTSETIDYSGNYVTGISRLMLEIDPSFSIGRWSFSFNARYFSRQYANRLNNAYFNGHWETFAGIRFQVNSHFQISVDAINLLNQSGVSGTLDVADTITDSRILQGYLTSGTYIRPFTLNLTFRWQK